MVKYFQFFLQSSLLVIFNIEVGTFVQDVYCLISNLKIHTLYACFLMQYQLINNCRFRSIITMSNFATRIRLRSYVTKIQSFLCMISLKLTITNSFFTQQHSVTKSDCLIFDTFTIRFCFHVSFHTSHALLTMTYSNLLYHRYCSQPNPLYQQTLSYRESIARAYLNGQFILSSRSCSILYSFFSLWLKAC